MSAFTGADLPVVGTVMEGSAAHEAGLAQGDVITKIGREPIHFYREVSMISALSQGEVMEITYERNGEKTVTTLTPQYSEEDGVIIWELPTAGLFWSVIRCRYSSMVFMRWSTG